MQANSAMRVALCIAGKERRLKHPLTGFEYLLSSEEDINIELQPGASEVRDVIDGCVLWGLLIKSRFSKRRHDNRKITMPRRNLSDLRD